MDLSKKLLEWQQAGLIDAATRARIEAHEGSGRRSLQLYALLGLGAVSVGLGVVSVVAANWDGLSQYTKLGADLALGLALALGTFHCARRGMALASDVLVIVYAAFTLASLALIGQVYQLNTPLYQPLATWSLATAPLMLLGHSRWLGVLWGAGLTLSFGVSCQALLEEHWSTLGEQTMLNLVVSLGWAWPLALIAATRRFLDARWPALASGMRELGWQLVLLGAALTTLPWYTSIGGDDTLSWGLGVGLALAVLTQLGLGWLLPEAPVRARHGVSALLGLALLSLGLGTGFERESIDVIAALFQLALLVALAYRDAHLGRVRSFNTWTALIALRLLIAYFEVFGSMLDTGLGMITGGLLTLALGWLWRKKSPSLARQLSEDAHG
jgi:uncharacterized membrane protein